MTLHIGGIKDGDYIEVHPDLHQFGVYQVPVYPPRPVAPLRPIDINMAKQERIEIQVYRLFRLYTGEPREEHWPLWIHDSMDSKSAIKQVLDHYGETRNNPGKNSELVNMIDWAIRVLKMTNLPSDISGTEMVSEAFKKLDKIRKHLETDV